MSFSNRKIFAVGLAILAVLLQDSIFIVDQGNQAIVVEFGKLHYERKEPGLYFKMPFYQNVLKYEKRMLDFEIPATELTLSDKKRVVVDVFMRYRITDPAIFYKTVRTENNARNRLSPLITGSVRNVLGTYNLSDILSEKRLEAMSDIRDKAQQVTKTLGISIIEVRISKTDLPKENSHAIYRQMISSLKKEAQKWRGQGREAYLKRVAKADRDSKEILSKAQLSAKHIVAKADRDRLEIFNHAYSNEEEFAKWFMRLQALQKGLGEQKVTLLMPEEYLTKV